MPRRWLRQRHLRQRQRVFSSRHAVFAAAQAEAIEPSHSRQQRPGQRPTLPAAAAEIACQPDAYAAFEADSHCEPLGQARAGRRQPPTRY